MNTSTVTLWDFPASMRPYLEPITPLPETDFCWRYTGPVSSLEDLSDSSVSCPLKHYRPAEDVRCSLFSGAYFRLDNDCFDINPTIGYADSDEKKRGRFVHIYQCRWCGLLSAVFLIVMVIFFGDLLFEFRGGWSDIKAIGIGTGASIGLLLSAELWIYRKISRRFSGTHPRIKFCRKTNQVFVMNSKGEVATIPWEDVTWVIGLSVPGQFDYQLFITRDGTSRFYETAIASNPYGIDPAQYNIRYIAAFHDFICHYMRYGLEYLSAFPKKTHFLPLTFWHQKHALGVVVLEPTPYPNFQSEWESFMDRSLRFLSRYLFYQFYPSHWPDEIHNFKAFPQNIERL